MKTDGELDDGGAEMLAELIRWKSSPSVTAGRSHDDAHPAPKKRVTIATTAWIADRPESHARVDGWAPSRLPIARASATILGARGEEQGREEQEPRDKVPERGVLVRVRCRPEQAADEAHHPERRETPQVGGQLRPVGPGACDVRRRDRNGAGGVRDDGRQTGCDEGREGEERPPPAMALTKAGRESGSREKQRS